MRMPTAQPPKKPNVCQFLFVKYSSFRNTDFLVCIFSIYLPWDKTVGESLLIKNEKKKKKKKRKREKENESNA